MLLLVIPILCFSLQSCHPKPQERVIAPTNPSINAEVGRLFLAKNKLKPGIHSLPNGLQFAILQDGLGVYPSPSDWVTLYYQGQYIDGRVFDNTHAQNKPIKLQVSQGIPGLQQALKMMLPGSVWVIYVPPQLAFGEKGIPKLVGPNQTLVYYVHLISVEVAD